MRCLWLSCLLLIAGSGVSAEMAPLGAPIVNFVWQQNEYTGVVIEEDAAVLKLNLLNALGDRRMGVVTIDKRQGPIRERRTRGRFRREDSTGDEELDARLQQDEKVQALNEEWTSTFGELRRQRSAVTRLERGLAVAKRRFSEYREDHPGADSLPEDADSKQRREHRTYTRYQERVTEAQQELETAQTTLTALDRQVVELERSEGRARDAVFKRYRNEVRLAIRERRKQALREAAENIDFTAMEVSLPPLGLTALERDYLADYVLIFGPVYRPAAADESLIPDLSAFKKLRRLTAYAETAPELLPRDRTIAGRLHKKLRRYIGTLLVAYALAAAKDHPLHHYDLERMRGMVAREQRVAAAHHNRVVDVLQPVRAGSEPDYAPVAKLLGELSQEHLEFFIVELAGPQFPDYIADVGAPIQTEVPPPRIPAQAEGRTAP